MNQDESLSAEKASSALSEAKDRLRQTAQKAAAQVKERASEIARDRKSGLADQIDDYREAVEKRTEGLEQEDPNLAWLAQQVTDRMRRASDYVRTTDFQQMRSDAEDLAHRYPALFFGGLFLGGLVVGNILKATAQETAPRASSSAPQPETYPENEDVLKRSEGDSWPAVPPSEVIK